MWNRDPEPMSVEPVLAGRERSERDESVAGVPVRMMAGAPGEVEAPPTPPRSTGSPWPRGRGEASGLYRQVNATPSAIDDGVDRPAHPRLIDDEGPREAER